MRDAVFSLVDLLAAARCPAVSLPSSCPYLGNPSLAFVSPSSSSHSRALVSSLLLERRECGVW